MSDKTISQLLADLGLRHARDEHSTNDYCHAIYEGDHFIARLDAQGAAKLVSVLSSRDKLASAIESRRETAESGEDWAFLCWLETRLVALEAAHA